MFLVCHVILQDHAIKGLCESVDGSPSWEITNLKV